MPQCASGFHSSSEASALFNRCRVQLCSTQTWTRMSEKCLTALCQHRGSSQFMLVSHSYNISSARSPKLSLGHNSSSTGFVCNEHKSLLSCWYTTSTGQSTTGSNTSATNHSIISGSATVWEKFSLRCAMIPLKKVPAFCLLCLSSTSSSSILNPCSVFLWCFVVQHFALLPAAWQHFLLLQAANFSCFQKMGPLFSPRIHSKKEKRPITDRFEGMWGEQMPKASWMENTSFLLPPTKAEIMYSIIYLHCPLSIYSTVCYCKCFFCNQKNKRRH